MHCIKLMHDEEDDPSIEELVKRTINEKPLLKPGGLPAGGVKETGGGELERQCKIVEKCVIS